MKRKKFKRTSAGFTMVELMAVLIILGLLATVAVRNFMGQTDRARVTTTKANLKVLHSSILQFKMDTGRYPAEEEGLQALLEEPTDVFGWQPGGYLDSTEIPQDAWGNDFIFQLDPESGKAFVIISYGADGEPEGEDYNVDLYSTDAH
jgi:general secretion pathway protein G